MTIHESAMNQLHLLSCYSLIIENLVSKDDNAARGKLSTLELRWGPIHPFWKNP